MWRIAKNSKWEWVVYAVLSTAILLGLVYYGMERTLGESPGQDWWFSWGAALIAVNVAVAYAMGRRLQRRIDGLQIAMIQAKAGNRSARLPELGADAFAGAYRDFNRMQEGLEERLRLLQELGERDIQEDAGTYESAVLEERRRLARDLHDTVSQQLFAIHMSASALPALLKRDADQADKVMTQLIAMSHAAQREMRGLIAQLRPLELEGRTLSEALDRWFPDYCRQNGLQGTLDIQLSGQLKEATEHQLFLIIQEAMANVVKHSKAAEVRLYLGDTDRQVTLGIDDDGNGFHPDQIRTGSFGLSTMRERAHKLGGQAEIVTKPGSGTRIRITLPKFEPSGASSILSTKETSQ